MDVALWNEYWMGLSMARWGEVQSEKKQKKVDESRIKKQKAQNSKTKWCHRKMVPQSEKFQKCC